MAVSPTISIPPKEAQAAIDNVLEKVSKQLRELNHYVWLYSSLPKEVV
jgi:sorbitol-specific phosphotransferase system component IIA